MNISGKYFNVVPYGVSRDTETIDYDALRALALEHRPKLIVGGASAYPRFIDFYKDARDRRRSRRHPYGGHGPYRGAHRRGPAPQLFPYRTRTVVTTTTHKTLRGRAAA